MRDWRGLSLALSLVALLMQVVVPAGYMVAQGANGPDVVICTGHGALVASADQHHSGKAPASRADAPCVFAGHGVLAPPADAAPAGVFPLSYISVPATGLWDLAPGRGLAAPPPPSQGPPRLI